jgi:hypothetical protein
VPHQIADGFDVHSAHAQQHGGYALENLEQIMNKHYNYGVPAIEECRAP